MPKKVYDSIDDLWEELVNDVEDITKTDVDEAVKEVYKDKIEKIYDSYMPKYERASRYRRGERGSFHDENNFKSNTNKNYDTIKYILHNERVSDCNCSYCRGADTHLDRYIEEGIAGQSTIIPRPVSEWTMEELESKSTIDNIVIKGLNKKGW